MRRFFPERQEKERRILFERLSFDNLLSNCCLPLPQPTKEVHFTTEFYLDLRNFELEDNETYYIVSISTDPDSFRLRILLLNTEALRLIQQVVQENPQEYPLLDHESPETCTRGLLKFYFYYDWVINLNEKTISIEHRGVAPECRNRGVMTSLSVNLLKIFKDLYGGHLWVSSHTTNNTVKNFFPPAIALDENLIGSTIDDILHWQQLKARCRRCPTVPKLIFLAKVFAETTIKMAASREGIIIMACLAWAVWNKYFADDHSNEPSSSAAFSL